MQINKLDQNGLDYAAQVVMEQADTYPDIAIPVSAELAEHMGAFYDPALDDDLTEYS